jgi:transcription initiation factor TFIID subunit 13
VKHMMYGFGDVQEPDKETVDLVEDMTLDYVTNFAHRCMEVSARRGKLQTEDLLYLIRNDEKKVQRVNELLDMNMQLKEARKNFSTDEAAIDPAK